MNKTIFKYSLMGTSEIIVLPEGFKLLCVQLQNGYPCVWAEVDRDTPPQNYLEVDILTIGTGHSLPDGYGYLGTYQHDLMGLVFHVYWRIIK